MGNKRDAILDALENLTVTEFKKFKLKLGSVQLRQGFRTIPRGVLGPLDAMDLTDKLIAFYCEDYGAELTAAVLCDMGMQQEAAQLQGVSEGAPGPSRSQSITFEPWHTHVLWTQTLFLTKDPGIQSRPHYPVPLLHQAPSWDCPFKLLASPSLWLRTGLV